MDITIKLELPQNFITAVEALAYAIGELKTGQAQAIAPAAAPIPMPAPGPAQNGLPFAQAPVMAPAAPVQPSYTYTTPEQVPGSPYMVNPGQPVAPQPQPTPPAPTVPTTAPAYTVEQLAVAATQLMDAKRQPELLQLLGKYGAQALTQLPKEYYGAFATDLRNLGVKI